MLIGNTGSNTLDGGAGAATLIGGAGNDVYLVDDAGDVVTELAEVGADTVKASVSYTLAANVANLNGTGNELVNVLTGNAGSNTLDGGVGADTLTGAAGNDVYLVDNVGDVSTELATAGSGTDTVNASVSYTLGANVENLTLLGGALVGTGNTLNNLLTGNDTLDGGLGADILTGGAGNDVYLVDELGDVVNESTGAGTDTVKAGIDYVLGANIENLTLTGTANLNGVGNALANVLTGNAGNNRLEAGLGGVDKLIGGLGNDVYVIAATGVTVTAALNAGTDTVESSVNAVLGANLENLILTGAGNINATGNELANGITGNTGNNTLAGGLGIDVLHAGEGADTLIYDAADTLVDGGTGLDTLQVLVANQALNLTSLTTLASLERLQLVDGGHVVTLDVASLLALSESHTLVIEGGASDSVVAGGGWTALSDAVGYARYTQGGTELDVALAINRAGIVTNMAPVIDSGATASFAENATGTVYTVTASDAEVGTTLSYSMSGADADLFNLNAATGAVTFKAAPNFEAPADAGGNNIYDITVSASDGLLSSTPLAVAITVTDVVEVPVAGQAVIDLGSYGKLIAPVEVDGGIWFYYWDRSGDGSDQNVGSLNGGVDYTTHDVLDEIFNKDINGTDNVTVRNADGQYGTTDTYRYATLNDVHLALPTIGVADPDVSYQIYQPGTAVGSLSPTSDGSNAANSTYNDLLAVWDAYNGTGSGLGSNGLNGTPVGWQPSYYWPATPSASGHALVHLTDGGVINNLDNLTNYVALQVLFNDSVPVITSDASTSVAENITGTVYTVTASDADAGAVLTYSMSGTDAALFNLNALTGAVSFIAAPDYEAPADAGQDNVYNISVTASHGSQSSAAQAVAITVTDVVEVPVAGQAVIDLGSYGKLIAPVEVDDGSWFYFWDRSGDGTSANSGSLNGANDYTLNGFNDYTTHDVLQGIFNQDINGNTGVGGNTTDVYRYATLNGVQVALPTAGGESSPAYGGNGIYNYQPGTAVGSSPASTGSNAVNSTYNDLLAVWDAYNGTEVGVDYSYGTPAGWFNASYWSATPSASGHPYVFLRTGYVVDVLDFDTASVALQVL